jgi:hypothetical protein
MMGPADAMIVLLNGNRFSDDEGEHHDPDPNHIRYSPRPTVWLFTDLANEGKVVF